MGITKWELGMLLGGLKNDLLIYMGKNIDTLYTHKKEKVEKALSIFCPICHKK